MKTRSTLPMQVAKYGYIAISIVFCLAGLALIVFPALSAHTIAICLGVAMLIFGAVKLVGYFSRDLYRLAFQYDLQFGILLIIMGIIVLVKPDNMLNFLSIALGICTLVDCLFKTKIALDAKKFGIRQWWLTMGMAIITPATVFVPLFFPVEKLVYGNIEHGNEFEK